MSPQLEQRLFRSHPVFFKMDEGGALPYGIECDDGWFLLLEEMCQAIDVINKDLEEPVTAAQIKEKFGTLRVYTDGLEPRIGEIIALAEHKSCQTCEVSGKPGALHRRGGCVKTLDPGAAMERNFTA